MAASSPVFIRYVTVVDAGFLFTCSPPAGKEGIEFWCLFHLYIFLLRVSWKTYADVNCMHIFPRISIISRRFLLNALTIDEKKSFIFTEY